MRSRSFKNTISAIDLGKQCLLSHFCHDFARLLQPILRINATVRSLHFLLRSYNLFHTLQSEYEVFCCVSEVSARGTRTTIEHNELSAAERSGTGDENERRRAPSVEEKGDGRRCCDGRAAMMRLRRRRRSVSAAAMRLRRKNVTRLTALAYYCASCRSRLRSSVEKPPLISKNPPTRGKIVHISKNPSTGEWVIPVRENP